MARRPRPVIEATRTGFVINLAPDEIELLLRLLDEVRSIITSDDPEYTHLLKRLFPPAYHLSNDGEAEAEYQRLMRDELSTSRLAAIATLETTLRGDLKLDEAAMHSLLQALNSVRLVLGTLLDVSESLDIDDIADDHPMVAEHHLYQYLSYLLDTAVDALTGQG